MGYQKTKYCSLSLTFLPFHFSAQIIIQWSVENFAGFQ